jgi:hypothetical protein
MQPTCIHCSIRVILKKTKRLGQSNMRFLDAAALVTCGILSLAATAMPARASSVTYDWSLTGPAASLGGVPPPGSGTITATVSASGGDAVTAITGTIGGNSITGLTSFDGSDNLLFPGGTAPLDTKGVAFATASGLTVDIFSFFAEGSPPSGNAFGELASGSGRGFGVGTFSLSPVAGTPLPASWTLMIAGLFGFGFIAFRGAKKCAAGLVEAAT